MATQPSTTEMNQRIDVQRQRIETTATALRLRLRQRMEMRDLLARHWKLSLGAAFALSVLAGRILRRIVL